MEREGRGRGFVWDWASNIKRMEEFWTLLDKRGGGTWKLNNFYGRHMCIVPYVNIVAFCLLLRIFIPAKQICVFSLFPCCRLRVSKNRSFVFSFFFFHIFTSCSFMHRFCKRHYHLMVLFLICNNKTFFHENKYRLLY